MSYSNVEINVEKMKELVLYFYSAKKAVMSYDRPPIVVKL